jgi:hypothetical protein
LDKATFWSCVRDGIKPDRGEPKSHEAALPADLVHLLVTRVRLTETEVAAMTREEAIARMQESWALGS